MATVGRPRAFDMDAAIESALMLFWEHGYEGTSLALLRAEIGVSSASFYAAFDSKEALFDRAVERYMRSYGTVTAIVGDETLAGRDAILRLLHDSIQMQTDPAHPRGCLVALSAHMTGEGTPQAVRKLVAKLRVDDRHRIDRRLERSIELGELREDTDVAALASAIHGFLLGISSQARDGAAQADLDRAAHMMLASWDACSAQTA